MQPLSVVIITYNEAHNIGRCLDAVKDWANEIIVLDSFSSDQTVAIAESKGAKVFQQKFEGYGLQKKTAVSKASHIWVLNLDADEVVSNELKQSIQEVLKAPQQDGYTFNRLTQYCGRWIKYSGWYPDPVLRLWNTQTGQMSEDKVHEGWQMNKVHRGVGHLKGDLLHYAYPDISVHLKKIEQYSKIGAEFDRQRGKKVSWFKLLFGPPWVFFVQYFIKQGFRDGFQGFVLCVLSAVATFVKYSRIKLGN